MRNLFLENHATTQPDGPLPPSSGQVNLHESGWVSAKASNKAIGEVFQADHLSAASWLKVPSLVE
jgi:hypothetical protein